MKSVDVTPEDRVKVNASSKSTEEAQTAPISNSTDSVIAKHEELIRQTTGLKSNQPIEQKNYSKMVEIVGLPSKMRQYLENSKLYGRPLELPEIKKLSGITPANANNTIIDIIRASTQGISVEDILTGDKIFIALWLRANTYPQNGYSVDFHCQQCDKSSTYDFKAENVIVNHINEEIDINEPVKLPNGDLIGIKYPTISDEIAANKFKEMSRRGISKIDNDFVGVSTAIFDINGEPTPLMERYRYVNGLDPMNYSYLTGFMRQFDFGIGEEMNVTCNLCGGTSLTEVTFRSDFFIPTYRFGKHMGTTV